jgi:uncharacterized protein YraI
MIARLGCTAAFAFLLASNVAYAQQVRVSKASTLHAEPRADAPVVTQLKEGTSAEVVGKQGAWVQVKSAAGTGWMFAFNVSYGVGGAAPAAAAPSQERRSTTATIGIRGLDDKEALKNATFDQKQLDALDGFADDAKK